jgi:PKD repeat protein
VGSTDPDGIRSYTWNWADTTPDTVSTSTSQSHVYLAAGTYTITLVVTDNWGKTTTVTHDVTVA